VFSAEQVYLSKSITRFPCATKTLTQFFLSNKYRDLPEQVILCVMFLAYIIEINRTTTKLKFKVLQINDLKRSAQVLV